MKKAICLLLIFFLARSFAGAQVDLHNTGILYLSNSTDTLYINGNFTNTAATALTNNGRLIIKQNLVNDQASMSAGTGTLYLNGTAVQTVSGTQTFKTFNFFSNNAAGITLNNDLSVAGTHTFTSGMINTSATPNYMIYEAGSSYTGSGDTRHVNGWVKKSGSTNFTFPVGNAVYERTIALTNLTANGEFNVRHNGPVTPNRFSRFNPLVFVDSSEYWTINKINGTAAQVAMNWDNSKIPFPNLMLSDIRAVYYDGVFWRSIGGTASGSVLTTGNITSGSVSTFNTNFTMGSFSNVLPLKIIHFAARRLNDYTKLNWTIGNELNVYRYELQRSDDGINFYTVYLCSPYNMNGTEFYSYDDRKILNSVAYYRLKINNLTAQINYSDIVTVLLNNAGKEFYIITNPFTVRIDLYADAALKGSYKYSITNTSGQLMQSGMLDIKNAGAISIHVNPLFAAGAYILVVQNETNRFQKTVIKN